MAPAGISQLPGREKPSWDPWIPGRGKGAGEKGRSTFISFSSEAAGVGLEQGAEETGGGGGHTRSMCMGPALPVMVKNAMCPLPVSLVGVLPAPHKC